MYKKLLSIFTLLVVLCMGTTARAAGTMTDEEGQEWQLVGTADELTQVVNSFTRTNSEGYIESYANIRLIADIDLSWHPSSDDCIFDLIFVGKLTGKYTEYNGQEANHALTNSSKDLLFKGLDNAEISYLNITDCNFTGWDLHSGWLGSTAKNCTFFNILCYNCTGKGDSNSHDIDRIGILVGSSESCDFTNIVIMNSTIETDGACAGLIAGEATNCKFDNCLLNFQCNVWADGNAGNAYAGGVCGYAQSCEFTKCINLALICAQDDRVGGIVGYGDEVTITDCYNGGIVCHNSKDGYSSVKDRRERSKFIAKTAWVTWAGVGTAYSLVTGVMFYAGITASVLFGSVFPIIGLVVLTTATVASTVYLAIYLGSQVDEVGGIAGAIDNGSKVLRCTNYGPVKCCDAYAGGIVGYAAGNSQIECCLNQSHVFAQQQAGGIVGKLDESTARDNINLSVVVAEEDCGMIAGEVSSDSHCSDNYYLDRTNHTDGGNYAVTQDRLASGEITMALNASIQSHTGAASVPAVFRQNLGESIYPTLDTSADVVTATTSNYNLWHKVSTEAEFEHAISNLTAKIELTADIDLSTNVLFSLFSQSYPFAGEIRGNGHTLKNMIILAQENEYDDDLDVNASLIAYADHATFEDLVIENFHITQYDENMGDHNVESILVANSNYCKYKNVTLRKCEILINSDNDYLATVGGIVANSNHDEFEGCTVEYSCAFQGHTSVADTDLGGIAAKAQNSVFRHCYNAAYIQGDDDRNGGIVGYANACTIEGCFNGGIILGRDYSAGIVGYAENGSIIRNCVNNGIISSYDNEAYDHHAGVVGCLAGNTTRIEDCINFGEINIPGDECGKVFGERIDGASRAGYIMWHCIYNNQLITDLYDSNTGTTWTIDQIKSGAFAATKDNLYQSIDNGIFDSEYPLPLPWVGKVYSNIHCNGEQSYSNIYQSSEVHTVHLNDFGFCLACGKAYNVPARVDIRDAQDCCDFSYAVNIGMDFTESSVFLTEDLDMKDVANYVPIGSASHPFCGSFDGQGHCIKNLVIENYRPSNDGQGFFGYVSGNTEIRNLAIDSTCMVHTSANYTGSIVGCGAYKTSENCTLNLINCSNAARVKGSEHVGGILGGMLSTMPSNHIIIDCCYNMGSVEAISSAAAICGYTGPNFTIQDSWNSGQVTGYSGDLSFFCYENRPTLTIDVSNCYNINTLAGTLPKISADDVKSGRLGFLLNGQVDGKDGDQAWHQEIGVDEHPYYNAYSGQFDQNIYHHETRYCYSTEKLDSVYTNSSDPVPAYIHDYDADGLCTAKEGEVHGQEPSLADDAWQISKLGHLYWVADAVNGGAPQHDCVLNNNITDNAARNIDGLPNPSFALHEWIPIGNVNHPFVKSFDGANHTISGLYSNKYRSYFMGLFGVIEGNASIRNVGVVDSYFYGAAYGGAIAAYAMADGNDSSDNHFPSITHCYSDCTIDHAILSGGGIVGIFRILGDATGFTSSLTDCISTSSVSYEANDNVSGGLLGYFESPTTDDGISDCYYLDGCTTGTSDHGQAMSEFEFRSGAVLKLLSQQHAGWAQSLGTDSHPVFGQTGVSYHRTVTAGNWGSLILPFAISSDNDVQLYTFKSFDEYEYDATLTLQPATNVPANTPCFFRTKGNCSMLSFASTTDGFEAPGAAQVKKEVFPTISQDDVLYYLIGSYEDIEVSSPNNDFVHNYFVAQNQLWWGEEAFSLPAFRAYIQTSSDIFAPAREISIVVDEEGESTQIGEIRDGELHFYDGKYFENGRVVIRKGGKSYDAQGHLLKL